MACIDQSDQAYIRLKEKTGLSDVLLSAQISWFRDVLNDNTFMPTEDDLIGVDNGKSIRDLAQHIGVDILKTDEHDLTEGLGDLTVLRSLFGDLSIQELNAQLNKEYSNLNTKIIPISQDLAKIEISPRPPHMSTESFGALQNKLNNIQKATESKEANSYDSDTFTNPASTQSRGRIHSADVWNNAFEILRNQYGISIQSYNTETANQFTDVPEAINKKGFIYNNTIYINTDLATIDTPIHELMHIFIGELRYNHPDQYITLLNKVSKSYPNMNNSQLEEKLVEFMGKLSIGEGKESGIFNEEDYHSMISAITRTLDTILNGRLATKDLFWGGVNGEKSLYQFATLVSSSLFEMTDTDSLQAAKTYRILANAKDALVEDGSLIEKCS